MASFFKTGMWKNTHPSGQKGHHGTHGTSEGPMSDVPFFVWAYPGHKLCPFEGMTGLMPFDLAFWPNTGRRGISGQLVGHHEGQRRPNGPLGVCILRYTRGLPLWGASSFLDSRLQSSYTSGLDVANLLSHPAPPVVIVIPLAP